MTQVQRKDEETVWKRAQNSEHAHQGNQGGGASTEVCKCKQLVSMLLFKTTGIAKEGGAKGEGHGPLNVLCFDPVVQSNHTTGFVHVLTVT